MFCVLTHRKEHIEVKHVYIYFLQEHKSKQIKHANFKAFEMFLISFNNLSLDVPVNYVLQRKKKCI